MIRPATEHGVNPGREVAHLRASPENPLPPGGDAALAIAGDGVRVRVAVWPLAGARGTVLLYPGRTEFAEMLFETVSFLQGAGWASATVDWRGQGASERLLADPRKGHIDSFARYQLDARCLVEACDRAGLPGPRVILANSMGAAIALRSMIERPEGAAGAILLGPMVGLGLGRLGRALAPPVAAVLGRLGLANRYAAGCDCRTVTERGFAGNPLTSSRTRFDRLEGVERTSPERVIGGVTWGWLEAALKEIRWLERADLPFFPKLVLLGDLDRVVDTGSIRRLAVDNPQTRLHMLDNCLHAILVEHDGAVAAAQEAIARFLKVRESAGRSASSRPAPADK